MAHFSEYKEYWLLLILLLLLLLLLLKENGNARLRNSYIYTLLAQDLGRKKKHSLEKENVKGKTVEDNKGVSTLGQ